MSLELNPVANLQALLGMYQDKLIDFEEFSKNMKQELDILERYMIHVGEEIKDANRYNDIGGAYIIDIVKWHEIKANSHHYHLNKEDV